MSELDLSKYEGHTPGPWMQSGVHIYGKAGNVATVGEPRASKFVRYVELEICSPDADEAFSNGRLIADAPLLLAEVKRLRAARQAWAICAAEESARADALLVLQADLLNALLTNCQAGPECSYCKDLVARARAAKVKHGE